MNSVLIIKLFTQAVRNVDEAIYLVFQWQMSAKSYGLIKNSTALGFAKTREVYRFIKLEFINPKNLIRFNLSF